MVRWNNLDILAFENIIQLNQKFFNLKISNNINNCSSNQFYENLTNSKYDEEANLNLGIQKLLNKDKKDFKYSNKIKITWSSLQVSIDKIIEKFSLNELKKEALNILQEKDLYLFNYRKTEENNSYSYVLILLSEEFKKNQFLAEKFSDVLNRFLKEKLDQKFYSIFKEDRDIYNIKLNQTITRKNFEPYINEFLQNLIYENQ